VIRTGVQSGTGVSGAVHASFEQKHEDDAASMQHAPPTGAAHEAIPLAPATSSWQTQAPLLEVRHAIDAQVQVEFFAGHPS
jgi:hypothetical protein